jgi:DNA-binding FadR family transcriptional regulator
VLQDRILAGGYAPGSRFPAERQVAEESGYSRNTVRKALMILRKEHRVEVIPGIGSHVTDPREWNTGR